MKRNTLNIDSNVFIFVRYFSFSLASLISIFLNIFFFQALDVGGFWYILFGISILLESAKVSTILTRNVFTSLWEKTRNAKIRLAKNFFLTMYLCLAILSIASGAGFSYYITETTDTIREIEVESLESKIDIMSDIRDRIEFLSDERREMQLSEHSPYIRATERLDEAERIFSEANREHQLVNARRPVDETLDNFDVLLAQWRASANSAWGIRSDAERQRNNARIQRDRVIAEFNDRGENTEERLSELEAEFNMMLRELDVTSPHLDLPLISRARLVVRELNQDLNLLNDRIRTEKGMQIIFDDLANFLNSQPKVIKLMILLFVAFLIELTIFQTAPDIRVSRRILYFFRNRIPTDVNINNLLKSFDEEIARFQDDFEPEPIPPEDPEPPKKIRKKRIKNTEIPIFHKPINIEEVDMKRAVESTIRDLPRLFPEDSPHAQERTNEEIEQEYEAEISKEEIDTWVDNIIEHPHRDNSPPQVKMIVKDPEPEIEEEKEVVPNIHKPEPEEEKLIPIPQENYESKDAKYFVQRSIPITNQEDEEIKKDNKIKHYRFGRASDQVINKAVEFIKLCIDGPGPFAMLPEDAANQLKFSKKAKEVFLEHLSYLKIKNRFLIYKKDDQYYSNFSSKDIINYMTQIVDD